jgi:FkbM family methyltransferase
MSDQTRTLRTSLGHNITVFTNDHVGDKIARFGLYEKENLQLLMALLKKINNPVVMDVGANIGNHTLAFSKVASQVLAFEPLPAAYALLLNNIQANHIANVNTFPFALSDTRDDETTIYMVRDGNVGASSFDKRDNKVESVVVKKRIGDQALEKALVKKVDFIKLDVEAHEAFVLRGLNNTLRQHKPIITMEWNDPLTIERLSGSEEMQFLMREYDIHVLGSNYDRGYWAHRSFPFIRRKLTRLFKPKKAALYTFNPARLYKNLLLIPKSKAGILDGLL